MKNRGSTLILTNLVGVHQKNIHTKLEANLCSGSREEVKKSLRRQQRRPTSEQCIYRASRPSQGTVNGVPSLNDLAVEGTLNTINQPQGDHKSHTHSLSVTKNDTIHR